MKMFRLFSIVMLYLFSYGSAYAITLSSGSSIIESSSPLRGDLIFSTVSDVEVSPKASEPQLISDYNIFVDGNMFLDYSVFSDNQDLIIGDGIVITGETIAFFSFNDIPIMPDLTGTTIFLNPDYSMSEVGSILFFSDSPILSGIFKATGDVLIGNYSFLQPVPLPAAALLFSSGLAMFSWTRLRKRLNKDDTKRYASAKSKALNS